MPSSEPAKTLAPHKQARLDQWNARLDGFAARTRAHVTGECTKPAGSCVGTRTADLIAAMAPVEARMLLEIAVVRIAGLHSVIYEPSFVCWVPNRPGEEPDDHEHDTALACEWGWVCNFTGCTFRTDDRPCPEHAPTDVPALRLVECTTEPRHWIWAHRNDDMGHGCPYCWITRLTAELDPLQRAELRRVHRQCWLDNRVKTWLTALGLMRITSWSSDCRYGTHVSARWRWAK